VPRSSLGIRPPRRLTKRLVEALAAPDGADYLEWDADLSGFGVRVTAHAGVVRRAYVYGYRLESSRRFRRITIGAHGKLTTDQARDAAKRLAARVVRGEDPAESRRRERGQKTVRELGVAYLEDVDARRKPSTAREYARMWARYVLPALGPRKVGEVVAHDVRRLHRALQATPYQANRVLAMVGAFFTFAEQEGARPPHDNPARQVKPFAERSRERFLTAAETAKLGEALARAEREGLPPAPLLQQPRGVARPQNRPKSADTPRPANPLAVAALRLLLLTGCREGEILTLRWDAVDLERGFLRLADTKTGKDVRPLGAAAAELLTRLPRLQGSPYVFPGARPTTPLQDLKRLWYAVRHAAGLPELRLHDLRHSYASVSAAGGDSLLVTRALLGHRNIATTQRYAHLSDDPVKAAADRTSAALAAWLEGSVTTAQPIRRERGARSR